MMAAPAKPYENRSAVLAAAPHIAPRPLQNRMASCWSMENNCSCVSWLASTALFCGRFCANTDIQAMSFYAWLKSKMLRRLYYKVLLELAHTEQ